MISSPKIAANGGAAKSSRRELRGRPQRPEGDETQPKLAESRQTDDGGKRGAAGRKREQPPERTTPSAAPKKNSLCASNLEYKGGRGVDEETHRSVSPRSCASGGESQPKQKLRRRQSESAAAGAADNPATRVVQRQGRRCERNGRTAGAERNWLAFARLSFARTKAGSRARGRNAGDRLEPRSSPREPNAEGLLAREAVRSLARVKSDDRSLERTRRTSGRRGYRDFCPFFCSSGIYLV